MRASIAGFAAGILWLQQQSSLPDTWILSLLAIFTCLFTGLSFWPRLTASVPAAKLPLRFASGILFGILWSSLFAQHYLNQSMPREWENRDMVLTGTIANLPHQFENGIRFNFQIERAEQNKEIIKNIPKKVVLSWYSRYHSETSQILPDIQPGQRWQLNVRMKRPHTSANPYAFDYEIWMLEQNLQATGYVRYDKKIPVKNELLNSFVLSPGNLINLTRSWIRERIQAALPGQAYAGVIIALVIGDQRAMSQTDKTVFSRTGVSHLVAISGLHITMVSGMFAAFFAALWRRSFFTRKQFPLILPTQKAAALAGLAMALFYTLLAGFGIPAQRTLYMLCVVAIALWTGRITRVSHVLFAALGIVLLVDPWAVLWPGFWLSFSAVGIILYSTAGRIGMVNAPNNLKYRWYRTFYMASTVQIAITIGLVPLTMLFFGQVSLLSPLANAIAIPLVSLLVTPLALIGSIAPSFLSSWILETAHFLVKLLAAYLEWLSALPFAVWSVPIPSPSLFFFALAGTIWMLAPRGWPARWSGIFCWLPLLFQTSGHPPQGEAWVTAFDIGQGSAILIETKTHRLLFDTGANYSTDADGGNRVILPYLQARNIASLDTLVVSHADNDHAGGALSILKEMPVQLVLSSLAPNDPVVKAAKAHQLCKFSQNWVWDDVQFEILHPTQYHYIDPPRKNTSNALSCVLKVTAQGHAILLTGDIESQQEMELVELMPQKLKSGILLAPHHGSHTSSSLDFLNTVQPEIAIFQMGYLNRYKHPTPEVYERYGSMGIKRFRTDESGAVTIRMGKTLETETYRSSHARYWYKK